MEIFGGYIAVLASTGEAWGPFDSSADAWQWVRQNLNAPGFKVFALYGR